MSGTGWDEPEPVDPNLDPKGDPIDICGDGGLIKTILREGLGTATPDDGDTVNIHYIATLTDGTEVDSSRKRYESYDFKLAEEGTIKAWNVGVKTMRQGERALFVSQPAYAYGKKGLKPDVPPNATLTFDIELLSWVEGEDILGNMAVLSKRLRPGIGQRKPKEGDEVTVSITGTALDKSVFLDEKNFTGIIGSKAFTKAVNMVLVRMNKGEVQSIIAQPEYAYKDATLPGHVQPFDAVTFVVELHGWLDISQVGGEGCDKVMLVEGDGKDSPNMFATVTITLAEGGSIANGVRKTVTLNEEKLPRAVEEAIRSMHNGETSRIVVYPSRQDSFVEKVIDTPRHYCVTLHDFVAAKNWSQLSCTEVLRLAETHKEMGNVFFKAAGNYTLALEHYGYVEELIEGDTRMTGPQERSATVLLSATRLNQAACGLKTGAYAMCVERCDLVLLSDPLHVKALYRKGCAQHALDDLDGAHDSLQSVVWQEPHNTAAKRELSRVHKKRRKAFEEDTKKFGKVLS